MAEDPELEAIRRAITPGTTRSFKRTLCAYLLIRAARRSTGRQADGGPTSIRRWSRIAISAGAVLAATHWSHVITLTLGHIWRLGRDWRVSSARAARSIDDQIFRTEPRAGHRGESPHPVSRLGDGRGDFLGTAGITDR
jgi:hypothetical protein